jgi:hypothetical protein
VKGRDEPDRWDASDDLCSFSGHLDTPYVILLRRDAGASSNYSYPDAVRFSARLPSAPMRARRHAKIFASTSIHPMADGQSRALRNNKLNGIS